MQIKSRCTIAGMLVMCVACTTTAADKPATVTAETTPPALPRADPPLFIKFSDTCLLTHDGGRESPFLLFLLGSVLKPLVQTAVPAAVGWAYDRGVHALDARRAKLQASSSSTTTTVMYNIIDKKYNFGCIILARATRGTRVETGIDYLHQEHGAGAILPPGNPWLPANSKEVNSFLQITRVPEFYFELAFGSVMSSPEKDPKVLNSMPALLAKGQKTLTPADLASYAGRGDRSMYRTIKPVHLDYFSSGAERVENGSKNVSIEIHFDAMDAKGEWKPFYSKTYDLGKLRINSADINVDSLGQDTFTPPPFVRTEDAYLDPVPVRVSAILTETDDNIDLSRALEIAFKDAQAKKTTVDAVAKAVVDKLQDKIDEKTGGDKK